MSEPCRALVCPLLLRQNNNANNAKTHDMKNRIKATLVRLYVNVREWGPLVILAIVVPGGSLLALLILRRQHRHTHGSPQ